MVEMKVEIWSWNPQNSMDKVKASQKKRDSRGLKSKKGKGWKCKELMMKIDWYVKACHIH